jgi:hypothetical protein
MNRSLLQQLHIAGLLILGLMMLAPGCRSPHRDAPELLIQEWYHHAMASEQLTSGFKTPVAARAYAYMGIGAWETARPFFPEHPQAGRSFAPESLSIPADSIDYFDLAASLHACYHYIVQKLFLTMPIRLERQQEVLYQKWIDQRAADLDPVVLYRSLQYGESVARRIVQWAETDTIAHNGQLHNFDKNYEWPPGPAFWAPCEDFPTPALLPRWGQARTFLIDADAYLGDSLPPFSDDAFSIYHVQAMEVLNVYSPLSTENRWIAEFWSDDHPGLTYSAAGRFMSILDQVHEQLQPPMEDRLWNLLVIGLTMSDAMVACWRGKYHHNLLRPETFIRRVFQPDWRPITHTPPFPGYPAGHAMLAGAAGILLTNICGPDFRFTDKSHQGRTEFLGEPRSFPSMREMAIENAYSRILLGVHFRMDCDEGFRLGELLGEEVLQAIQGTEAAN